MPLSAALAAAVAFGVAAVLQALAVVRAGAPADGVDPRLLLRLLREKPFLAALALNAVGFALHVVALQSLPLFLVQAALAGSVAVTAVLAVGLLHEPLLPRHWVAVAAVCTGLVLLAAAAEASPAAPTSVGAVRVGLFAGVALVALLGVLAGRWRGALGAVLLGLVAGAGFAVVAVAARLLPHGLAPGAVLRDPALVVLCLGGAVGFLLYATAMQHGSVTLATASLVVTQTAVPAVLGVVLLGDRVRPDGAALALSGFVLALAGATALARFEHLVPPPGAVPTPRPPAHPAPRGQRCA